MHLRQFFSGINTPRNIFIAALAASDFALCVITIPITLVGILCRKWPFGTQTWLLCKLVRTWPAVNVSFSSYSIVLIAIDRYRFIVKPAEKQVSKDTILKQFLREPCLQGFVRKIIQGGGPAKSGLK